MPLKRTVTDPGGIVLAPLEPDRAAERRADGAVGVRDLVLELDVVALPRSRRTRRRAAARRAPSGAAGSATRATKRRGAAGSAGPRAAVTGRARRRARRRSSAGAGTRPGRSPRRGSAGRATRAARAPPRRCRACRWRRPRACRRTWPAGSGAGSRCRSGRCRGDSARTMMQPSASIAAVPNEYSSAPSSAATSTSRPVLKPPSTRTRTRSRRPSSIEHLLRVGQAELPRQAGVLDRRQRRRAGAAVGPRDLHDVGQRLDDAGRDRADAGLADELHRHVGERVDLLEVEDQLREVLDRVDVVVRRRRDQADPGLGVPQPRDLAR